MGFYEEWLMCIQNNTNDDYYINSFLYQSNSSVEQLEKSSKSEIEWIIEFLISYDKEKIIDKINYEHVKQIMPCDVAQFSNLEKSTLEITHILKYEENGLTFEELGYLLNSAPNKPAATKYGENQSKTAKIFSLVDFSTSRPIVVSNTSLGNVFPLLPEEKRNKLLSVLCLRDPVIKCFIAQAKLGNAIYNDITCCLSETTSIRRKSNINTLLSLALKEHELLNKIKI